MRKLIGSVVIGLAMVAGLMFFVAPSLANQPDAESHLGDRPPADEASTTSVRLTGQSERPSFRRRTVSLRGTIADLPSTITGTWTVTDELGSLWTITVTEDTKIAPPDVTPSVGDAVLIVAAQQHDDEPALLARYIVVKERREQRTRPIQFHGVIEDLPPVSTPAEPQHYWGDWVISGKIVNVNAETTIRPENKTPEIGMMANVIALEQEDGTLWAKIIVLYRREADVQIEGTIEQLPAAPYLGTWIVDGFTVTVTATTDLKGATPALSLTAKVKGQKQDDGSILATDIVVKGPDLELVDFEGKLLVFSDTRPSEWIIETETPTGTEQISVTVTEETYVNDRKGPVEYGAWVEVKALKEDDGTLTAVLIKVEDDTDVPVWVEFEGTVVTTGTIPGDWVIETISSTESVTVHVTNDTRLVPCTASLPLTLGTSVRVKALQLPDGTLLAVRIEIADADDGPGGPPDPHPDPPGPGPRKDLEPSAVRRDVQVTGPVTR